MLLTAHSLRELDFGALMCIYEEGNMEKAQDCWPELPVGQGLLMAENDFFQYLKEVFFTVSGSVYCIWEENGTYVSALRLEPYRDGLLVEAVETAPHFRRHGYGEKLLHAVISYCDGTKLYSHVGKRNEASLKLHQKCGFRHLSDYAVYIDGSVNSQCCTLVYSG